MPRVQRTPRSSVLGSADVDRGCRALALAVLFAIAGTMVGCGDDTTPPEAQIKRILVGKWQANYAGQPGGLTAAVITPRGEYVVSTIEGVGPGSHFRGASTTKTFTAASIMLLEQRGRLNVDDLITANIPGTTTPYVPATPAYAIPYKSQITIRQLLGHRAGVFDVGNVDIPKSVNAPYAGQRYVDWATATYGPQHTFTIAELVGVVAQNQLVFTAPGQEFHYSNTGISIAAAIVEQVTGKSMAQFVHDEFLVPNGLTDTAFPDDGRVQDLPAPFVEGTTKADGQYYPTTSRNVSWGVGEGNVVTTPADLARWIRRLVKGQAGVDAAHVARMIDCQPTYEQHVLYGLGIECNPTALGAGHNGAITGYLTVARHDPATDVTVVVFASLFDVDAFQAEGELLVETAGEVRAVLGY
jgi:D-alanyl-D-alanine carboxypeptidase